MATVSLQQVNDNILSLKQEIEEIKGLLDESQLELSEDAKICIKESRKRPVSQFKTQEAIEKKFL